MRKHLFLIVLLTVFMTLSGFAGFYVSPQSTGAAYKYGSSSKEAEETWVKAGFEREAREKDLFHMECTLLILVAIVGGIFYFKRKCKQD